MVLIIDLDFKILVIHSITSSMDVYEYSYIVAICILEGFTKTGRSRVRFLKRMKSSLSYVFELLKVKMGAF